MRKKIATRVIGSTLLLLSLGTIQSNATTLDLPINGYQINGNVGENVATGGSGDVLPLNTTYRSSARFSGDSQQCLTFAASPGLVGLSPCDVNRFLSAFKNNPDQWTASSNLRLCSSDKTISCLSDLALTDPNSQQTIEATFDSYQRDYTAAKQLVDAQLPDLGAASIWNIDKKVTLHEQGKVLIIPTMTYQYYAMATSKINTAGWLPLSFSLEVIPFYSIPYQDLPLYDTKLESPLALQRSAGYDMIHNIQGHACPRYALWATNTDCYLRDNFSSNLKVVTSVVLPKSFPLRFSGRVSGFTISVQSLEDFRKITFSGSPFLVPGVMITDWRQNGKFWVLNAQSLEIPTTHSTLDKLRKIVGDKSSYYNQVWKLVSSNGSISYARGTPTAKVKQIGSCIGSLENKNLQSFVGTNAMMGQPTAPTFDGKTMKYQLAGMHFDSSGQVFFGDYQVVLNASFAKCVYGVTGSPKVVITITDLDGASQRVFTQNFTEKNGLYYIRISGFHFSDPQVSIALN